MRAGAELALRVAAAQMLSPTIRYLRLTAADGGLLPAAGPGAHLVLTLPARTGSTHRSYSLIGAPDAREAYEIAVRREAASRGGSAFLHAAEPGMLLRCTWPASHFAPVSTARRHLMIAGGVGITPFLSYLQRLRADGSDYALHYCARPDDARAFERWLAGDTAVTLHCGTARSTLNLSALLSRQPLGTHLYVCGPQGLMAEAVNTALGLGWPARHLHTESFGAAPGAPFTAVLARSGLTLQVGAHESLLERLEAEGVVVASLCRGGACGVCATELLAGEPEHRDHFLSEAEKVEGRRIMVCTSRARSGELVLNL